MKAAEKISAVLVDCSKAGQNEDLQKKYNVKGYPTMLFVSSEEKVLEDVYPQDGPSFAKKIEEILAKNGPKPWITEWGTALETGHEAKKPVVVIFAEKKDFKEWDDVKKWLEKELKKDFEKFTFGYTLPESEERKKIEEELGGGEKERANSFVALDPRKEKPFEKPLADPGKLSEKKVIEEMKKVLKNWKPEKKK